MLEAAGTVTGQKPTRTEATADEFAPSLKAKTKGKGKGKKYITPKKPKPDLDFFSDILPDAGFAGELVQFILRRHDTGTCGC